VLCRKKLLSASAKSPGNKAFAGMAIRKKSKNEAGPWEGGESLRGFYSGGSK